MFTNYGSLGMSPDYEGSSANITYIEFIFKTKLVTQLPMDLVIEQTDYHFNVFIEPYGNGGKKIKEVHILDKSNKPLYYCIFKDTKDIFWKQFVTEIKLNFSFDKSDLKQSTIQVELKSPQPNTILNANYLKDKYIVNIVQQHSSGVPIFQFVVDPLGYEINQRLYNTYKFGGKSKKSFTKKLRKYSNPLQAQRMAYKYLGKSAKLYPARNSAKKYSIFDRKNKKWVNFGQIGYEDYTKHKDKKRRKSYLTRSRGMLGDWKKNKYSANNLSMHILW
jgi:hypothetical protein